MLTNISKAFAQAQVQGSMVGNKPSAALAGGKKIAGEADSVLYMTDGEKEENRPATERIGAMTITGGIDVDAYISGSEKDDKPTPKLTRRHAFRKGIKNEETRELLAAWEANASVIEISKMVKNSLPLNYDTEQARKLETKVSKIKRQILNIGSENEVAKITQIRKLMASYEGELGRLKDSVLEAMAKPMTISKDRADVPAFLKLFGLLDQFDRRHLEVLCDWPGIPEELISVLNGKLLKAWLGDFIKNREPGVFWETGNPNDRKELGRQFAKTILNRCQSQSGQSFQSDAHVLANYVTTELRENIKLSGVGKEILEDKLRMLDPAGQMLLVDFIDIINQHELSDTPPAEGQNETLSPGGLAKAIGLSLFGSPVFTPDIAPEALLGMTSNLDYLPQLQSLQSLWPDIRKRWLEGKITK